MREDEGSHAPVGASPTPPDSKGRGLSEVPAALALLEAQIAAEVEGHLVPGASVAVVHEQELVWARGFGYADLERRIPARPDTAYGVGSITKLFTTTMLMQLRDAGKLRLDDPVQDYLPDVKVPRRHPGAPEITFRHLVTHTSGLIKDAPVGYWHTREFPTAERVMELLAETEQPYPPETVFKYSNLGLGLLGFALARIAGQPWEAYVDERILQPLGMANSAPRLTDALLPRVAVGYERPVAGWPPPSIPYLDLGGIGPGGSLHSTVVDMARFLADQLAPEPITLQRSTVLEMQRVHWMNPDWKSGRGLGWSVIRTDDGATFLEHGGSVYGFTCQVLLSPADRFGLAIFTNGSDWRARQVVGTLVLQTLLPAFRHAAQPRVPTPARASPAWQRYLGRYRWVFDDMEVAIRDGDLVLLMTGATSTIEVPLLPESENTFRMPSGGLQGERLQFVLDTSGQAIRAWVGPHPYERICGS